MIVKARIQLSSLVKVAYQRYENGQSLSDEQSHIVDHLVNLHHNSRIWSQDVSQHYQVFVGGDVDETTNTSQLRFFELQFMMTNSNNSSWERRYEQLVQYKANNQTTVVPINYESNPTFGKWVEHHRYQCRWYGIKNISVRREKRKT